MIRVFIIRNFRAHFNVYFMKDFGNTDREPGMLSGGKSVKKGSFVMKRSVLILTVCVLLVLTLTGCNDAGKAVSKTASMAGDALSKAGEEVSRLESRMSSDADDLISGVDDGLDSMGDSSTVDSGTDGFIGEEDTDGNGADEDLTLSSIDPETGEGLTSNAVVPGEPGEGDTVSDESRVD